MLTGTEQRAYVEHAIGTIALAESKKAQALKLHLRSCGMPEIDTACIYLMLWSMFIEDRKDLIPYLVDAGVQCGGLCGSDEIIVHDNNSILLPSPGFTSLLSVINNSTIVNNQYIQYTPPAALPPEPTPVDQWFKVGETAGAPLAGEDIFRIPVAKGYGARLEINKIPQSPINWDGGWYSKPYGSELLVLYGFQWAPGDLVHLSFFQSPQEADRTDLGSRAALPFRIRSSDFTTTVDYQNDLLTGKTLKVFLNTENRYLAPGEFLLSGNNLKILLVGFNAQTNANYELYITE